MSFHYKVYRWLGVLEGLTGLSLMLFPSLWSQLLCRSEVSAEADTFFPWIGAFVLGVGIAYWTPDLKQGNKQGLFAPMVIRCCVSALLCIQVSRGLLSILALGIALYDFILALQHFMELRSAERKASL